MDGWKILLDCGWNDAMDVELLAPLAKVAPFVDAVLVVIVAGGPLSSPNPLSFKPRRSLLKPAERYTASLPF